MSSSSEAFDADDVTIGRSDDVSVIELQSLQLEESRDTPRNSPRQNNTLTKGCAVFFFLISDDAIPTLCGM